MPIPKGSIRVMGIAVMAKRVWLYGVKQEIALAALAVRHGAERSLATLDVPELDKTFVPFSWSIEARLAWFAGLIDTDGTLSKDGQVHVWSVNRRFLREVRLLLTTTGVSAKIGAGKPAGLYTWPDGRTYPSQQSYRL